MTTAAKPIILSIVRMCWRKLSRLLLWVVELLGDNAVGGHEISELPFLAPHESLQTYTRDTEFATDIGNEHPAAGIALFSGRGLLCNHNAAFVMDLR